MDIAVIATIALAVQGALLVALLRMPRREPQRLAVRASTSRRSR